MNEKLIQEAQGLVEVIAPGGDGSVVLWAAVLAAVFKVVLSAIKMTTTWAGWWSGAKAKTALRTITLALGFGTFLVANIAAGMSWWESLIIGLAGPGSIVVHEYSKLFRHGVR